jgi:hypothetical protein
MHWGGATHACLRPRPLVSEGLVRYRAAAVPLGFPRRGVIHGTWRLASLRALAAILSSGIPTDAVSSRKWLKLRVV